MEQPIKYITVIMNHPTSTLDLLTRKSVDAKGTVIILDDEGLGEFQNSPDDKEDVKPVLGILMESFPYSHCQTKIAVQGVIPAIAYGEVDSGDLLYAHDGRVTTTNTTTVSGTIRYNPYVGVALSHADSGEWVSVLIK